MRKLIMKFAILFLATICLLGCSMDGAPSLSAAERLAAALEGVANGTSTDASFDEALLPANARTNDPSSFLGLGKYVLGEYYTDDISSLGTILGLSDPEINDWGAPDTWTRDGVENEPVRFVNGNFVDEVRLIFQVEMTDTDPAYRGKYHVYRYFPWRQDGNYGAVNIWFGNGHVFYLDPVEGSVLPGEPYLELFPKFTGSFIVKEARIEKTSFFEYRGVHSGGDNNGDPGSSPAEMAAAFEVTVTTQAIASMNDIIWSARNTLFTYQDGVYTHGYAHYENSKISCRVFFGGWTGSLCATAMYFVNR